MFRPTLSSALNRKSLTQAIGKCPNQDRQSCIDAVNEAVESLLIDPLQPDEGWLGTWATMFFNVTPQPDATAIFTTPFNISRIIVLDICNRATFLRNGFYEYLQFGNGHRPKGCCGQSSCRCDVSQGFDRPNVPLLSPFPTTGPQIIRVYPTDARDVGRRFIVQGPDQNGNQVLGTDATTGVTNIGETLLLQLPFVQSQFQYQNIEGLMKDVTNGPVSIFAVDPNTQQQTQISSMAFNETTASYRQYLLVGLPQQCCNTGGPIQIYAQAKLDYVPVAADQDYLSLPNLQAVQEECQSKRYSRMDAQTAPALEKKHHDKAIAYLNGQLDAVLGKVRTAIAVPIFGSNRLRPSFM